MKIVDRYIIKRFLTLFILIYVSLLCLFVVIDISANMSDFTSSGVSTQILLVKIFEYYFLYFFRLVDLIFPMLLFTSASATLIIMSNKNEMIALLATGVSPARILTPLLIGAFGVSCALTAVREVWAPNQLVNMTKSPRDFVADSDEIEVNRTLDDRTKLSVDADKILFAEGTLLRPKVMLNYNLNKYGSRIIAKTAVYNPGNEIYPSGWKLSGVTTPLELLKNPSLRDVDLDEEIISTPFDHKDLKSDEVYVATSITPTLMTAGENWHSYGRLSELFKGLKDPTVKGKVYIIAIHAYTRCLRPITDMLPLFLGLPFAFLGKGKSIYRMLIYGAIMVSAFMIFQFVCLFVANSCRTAAIAIWGPILVFFPIAVNIYTDLFRKEY